MNTILHWLLIFFFSIISMLCTAQSTEWLVPLSENTKNFNIYRIDSSEITVGYIQNNQSFLSINGKLYNPKGIDSITLTKNGDFFARKNGFWGIFDIFNDRFIIPPVYDEIQPINNQEFYKVQKHSLWAIINKENKKIRNYSRILPYKYNKNIIKLNDGSFLVLFQSKWYPMKGLPDNEAIALKTLIPVNKHFWAQDKKKENWFHINSVGQILDTLNISADFKGFDIDNIVFIDRNTNDSLIYSPQRQLVNKIINSTSYGTQHYTPKKYFDTYIISPTKDEQLLLDTNKIEILHAKSIKALSKNLVALTNKTKQSIYSIPQKKTLYQDVYLSSKMKNYQVINNQKKCGLIDINDGSEVFPMRLTSCRLLTPYVLSFKKKDEFGSFSTVLFSHNGKSIHLDKNKRYHKRFGMLIEIKENGHPTFYYDHNLDSISAEKIDFRGVYDLNNFFIVKKQGKFGIIDKDLNAVLPIIHDYFHNLGKGYLKFGINKKNGLFGVIGEKLYTFLPAKYSSIKRFRPNNLEQSTFLVKTDDKYGLFNFSKKETKTTVPIKYQSITPFKKNSCLLELNNKFGLADLSNDKMKIIIPVEYDSIALVNTSKKERKFAKFKPKKTITSRNTYKVWKENKIGIVQLIGNQLITQVPVKYDNISYLGGDNYLLQLGDKFGIQKVLKKHSKLYIPVQYDSIEALHPFIYKLQQGDKFGLVRVNN